MRKVLFFLAVAFSLIVVGCLETSSNTRVSVSPTISAPTVEPSVFDPYANSPFKRSLDSQQARETKNNLEEFYGYREKLATFTDYATKTEQQGTLIPVSENSGLEKGRTTTFKARAKDKIILFSANYYENGTFYEATVFLLTNETLVTCTNKVSAQGCEDKSILPATYFDGKT